jgi:hypothetical protein
MFLVLSTSVHILRVHFVTPALRSKYTQLERLKAGCLLANWLSNCQLGAILAAYINAHHHTFDVVDPSRLTPSIRLSIDQLTAFQDLVYQPISRPNHEKAGALYRM